jgi:hypothetical protein
MEGAHSAQQRKLSVGERATYRRGDETWGCTVLNYMDDNPPYYTVRLDTGAERQTPRDRLVAEEQHSSHRTVGPTPAPRCGAPQPSSSHGARSINVRLLPACVLRAHHVKDALRGVSDAARNVTVWIHSSTQGIEKKCFYEIEIPKMKCVSRILVSAPEHRDVKAVVLGIFMAKLRAYELDLVDLIIAFVTHTNAEMHRVGDNAFRGCGALKEVVLPRSITHLGYGAFMNCTALTSAPLTNSLNHLGDRAFHSCTSLTSVTLPNSLTRIGFGAFGECTSLTTVRFPNSLTHISNGAFYECTSLRTVRFPKSLTHIGDGAFSLCSALARVTMPAVHPIVGFNAFLGCPFRSYTVLVR